MPKILLTIDTEIGDKTLLYNYNKESFDKLILGKQDGREVGTRFIMDTIDQYKIPAEFFLSVSPYRDFNFESKFKDLAQEIICRGHYVQSHTHPLTNFNKQFMYELTKDDQKIMIQESIDKITEWTKIRPIAHRAGSYGANNETIDVLREQNIKYDLSYFYQNPNCRLVLNTINNIIDCEGVIQIPVTVFNYINHYGIFKKNNYRKLDIESISKSDEIIKYINLFDQEDIIILFLHSFSFLNFKFDYKKMTYTHFSINYNLINEFKNLIDSLANMFTFISIKDVKKSIEVSVPVNYDFFRINAIKKRFI